MNRSQTHHCFGTSGYRESRTSVLPRAMRAHRPDAALVQSCQHGDKQAFDLLMRKYQGKVRGLVSRRIRDSSEVPDVAQEVFLNAYRALPGFRGESEFSTWLYRIAINTADNYFAFKKRRQVVAGTQLNGIEIAGENLEQKDLDTPEHFLLTDEIQKTVLDAIDRLSVALRQALTLRELEGLSYEEIGQILKCPTGTVGSRIFRAREAVNARLKPLLG